MYAEKIAIRPKEEYRPISLDLLNNNDTDIIYSRTGMPITTQFLKDVNIGD